MIDNTKEEQDIMSAREIVVELQKLIDSEKSENEPGSEADASLLEDAVASLEKFISAEKDEEEPAEYNKFENKDTSVKPGVVDTSVLTGPINGLKNFLIKRQQDNQ
jgi:hypothetical protein